MKPKKILKLGKRINSRFPILGKLFRRSAIQQLAAERNDPAVIPILANSIYHIDKTLRNQSLEALKSLESPSARDELIEQALSLNNPEHLIQIINSSKYHHSEEGRWFLYLALAGRFEEYLSADFEFRTLRPEFRAAPHNLQNRIREKIVASGDVRMNPLFISTAHTTTKGALTDADAEVLIKVNSRNRNWLELFNYLPYFPARSIAKAVRVITDANWQPDNEEDNALLSHLRSLIPEEDAIPPPGKASPMNPVIARLLKEGADSPPQGNLESMISDEKTDPETGIRAMGALQKQGKLSPTTLKKAADSPHWLVRLCSAMLGTTEDIIRGEEGRFWLEKLQVVLDADKVWGAKPWQLTRDGLEALQKQLARLDDPRKAGGLPIVAAISAHLMAIDFETDEKGAITIAEDAFEIG